MIRKKITWVEGLTNYNHKIITCSKLTPNFKVFRGIKKLSKKNERLFKITPIYIIF